MVREIPPERIKVYEEASRLPLPIPSIYYVGYDASQNQCIVIEELITLKESYEESYQSCQWFTLQQLTSHLKGDEVAIALGLVRAIEAVVKLHAAGFVHGNLTPKSILFRFGGDVLLTGLGCLQRLNGASAPCIAYSRYYVCREQIEGFVCPGTDVRLLSLAFIEAYLGHHPMTKESITEGECVSYIANHQVVFRSDSPVLCMLSRMTAVESAERPDFCIALSVLLEFLETTRESMRNTSCGKNEM
jgi:serine/threonine protein kinase